ncbi:MAG: hypothetical protein ACYSWO_19810 [Planctomycetota bacterium]
MKTAQLTGLDAIRPGLTQGLMPTNGLYSAWNWETGLYDYYESSDGQRPSYGDEVKLPPTHNSLGSSLGEDPDRSSHGIPTRAKFVGSGPVALGEIVSVVPSAESISPWIGVALALAIPTALLWLTTHLGDVVGERTDRRNVDDL